MWLDFAATTSPAGRLKATPALHAPPPAGCVDEAELALAISLSMSCWQGMAITSS